MEPEIDNKFRDLLIHNFPNIYQTQSDVLIDVGWNDIVYELSQKINETGLHIRVCQVKEKFGELRFYYSPKDETINQLIAEASKKASKTCEKCGQLGRLYDNQGWISIFCESHRKPRQQMNFSVDKEKSLAVIKELLSHLKESDQIMISPTMDSEYYDNPIDQRHKLAIVELFLENCNESDYIQEVSEQIYEAYNNSDYDRSDHIEIHYGSFVSQENSQDELIHLTAYLHGTQAECDVSYPCFSYDKQYECWIIKDDFWGAKRGIDCNGTVTILDFSEYNL